MSDMQVTFHSLFEYGKALDSKVLFPMWRAHPSYVEPVLEASHVGPDAKRKGTETQIQASGFNLWNKKNNATVRAELLRVCHLPSV